MNEYCFSTNPNTILKPDFGKQGFDDIDSFLKISLVVGKYPIFVHPDYPD